MKHTETYKVNVHDTDLNGLLSPTGYMRYMQDAAFCQMESDGPSYDELFSRGLSFILSRMRILFFEPVISHEEITVSSWACESRAASFIRCYDIFKGGREAARAKSVWALFDVGAKRLCRVKDIDLGYKTDEEAVVDIPHRPEFLTEPSVLGEETVKYTHIDRNRHMNNTVYADMLWNYVPSFEKKRITCLDISYLSEAPLGEKLTVLGGDSENGYLLKTLRSDGSVNVLAEISATDI